MSSGGPRGEPGRGGAQIIPRPPSARPGSPPVWASFPRSERQGIRLARVREVIDRRGPVVPVRASAPRIELPSFMSKPAAVLIPLFEEAGETSVILTRRSSRLRSHTGEVSFPGGRVDPGEAPLAAALREAAEEVGLNPVDVEIVGELSPLSTMSSRAAITPFVGVLARRPHLSPNPAEVERVFDVSLAELASDGVYHEELWELPEIGMREMNFFHLVGDTVWGATARMLRELLELIFQSQGTP